MISAALHALLGLLLLIGIPSRKIEEPREQSITVELMPADNPQLANAPNPLPLPLPPSPEQNPDQTTQPVTPDLPKSATPTPPPPPPPPPPAHTPTPAPPTPTPPTPAPPAPAPTPTPPAPTPPTPARPTPTPPPAPAPSPVPAQQQALPTPPLPVPPPPAPPQPQQAQPTPQPTQQQQAAAQPAPPTPTPPLPLPPPPVPPPPTPSQTAGTGQTPPVERPAERSTSVQNTLDRLRAAQQQQEPPRARASSAAGRPASGGGSPTGNALLSQGEVRGVADRISECWSVDAGMLGLDQIVVELQVDVDAGGTIRNVRAPRGVPSDPRARAVFESARRALLDPKCSPLPIPREKLQSLNNAIFRFNPRGLIR